jgi:hypothetical protein
MARSCTWETTPGADGHTVHMVCSPHCHILTIENWTAQPFYGILDYV